MGNILRYINYFKLEIIELTIIFIVYYFILINENLITKVVFFATVLPIIFLNTLGKILYFTGIKIKDKIIGKGRIYLKRELMNTIQNLEKTYESIYSIINKLHNNEPITSMVTLETDAWPIFTYILKYDFVGDIEPDLYSKMIELFDRINTINHRLYFMNNIILGERTAYLQSRGLETIIRLLYDIAIQIRDTLKTAKELYKKL